MIFQSNDLEVDTYTIALEEPMLAIVSESMLGSYSTVWMILFYALGLEYVIKVSTRISVAAKEEETLELLTKYS